MDLANIATCKFSRCWARTSGDPRSGRVPLEYGWTSGKSHRLRFPGPAAFSPIWLPRPRGGPGCEASPKRVPSDPPGGFGPHQPKSVHPMASPRQDDAPPRKSGAHGQLTPPRRLNAHEASLNCWVEEGRAGSPRADGAMLAARFVLSVATSALSRNGASASRTCHNGAFIEGVLHDTVRRMRSVVFGLLLIQASRKWGMF